MMIFVFVLTLLGMYLLFISSEKHRSPKSTGHFKSLAQKYYPLFRISAFLLFALSGFLLIKKYGFSIGFVSWWIFATPLTFLLILWLNRLRASRSSSKS
ncbi:DUF1634 domain-containing protein [Acinetobacter sp. V110_1]|uniref:DUF3325 family protein n=1 Tax=Acinetobacter sp. V110_1 TaxID=3072988 RepID=UPI00287BEBA4|nr:DUF1634 domain-containing protein [Acinetobacter sp. V110_1]MDS7944914.1 DUF1634 domain-containing protein [Acinetobacter sp. V110_1]